MAMQEWFNRLTKSNYNSYGMYSAVISHTIQEKPQQRLIVSVTDVG